VGKVFAEAKLSAHTPYCAIGERTGLRRATAFTTAMQVTSAPGLRRGGRRGGEDVFNHHALQHIVLINIEMADVRHMLQINVLQHATEALTPVDRIAKSIGDVVIDVPIDVSRRGHAGRRI